MASLFSGFSPKQDQIAKEWEKMHQSKSHSYEKLY